MVRLLGEFTYWVLFSGLQECSRRKERKREKNWGDRKTCQKRELQLTYITTIGEIDCENKSMLKLHVSY